MKTRKLITCYECVLLDPVRTRPSDNTPGLAVSPFTRCADRPLPPSARPRTPLAPILHPPLYTFTLPAPASRPSPVILPLLAPYRTVVIFSDGKVFKELHACAFTGSQNPGPVRVIVLSPLIRPASLARTVRNGRPFRRCSVNPSFSSKPIDFHTFRVPISHDYSEVLARSPHAIDNILNVIGSPQR